jgi:hypothetical protein
MNGLLDSSGGGNAARVMSREEDPHMGRPSQRKHSAQRPGQRERARVKKRRRLISHLMIGGHGPRAGTFTLKAGRKKWEEAHLSRRSPWSVFDARSIRRGTISRKPNAYATDGVAGRA